MGCLDWPHREQARSHRGCAGFEILSSHRSIVGASLLAMRPPQTPHDHRAWIMLNRSPTTISVIQSTRIEV